VCDVDEEEEEEGKEQRRTEMVWSGGSDS